MTIQTKHVLVVDDDELARMEIARCVEQQGYSATVAENGTIALDMLGSQPFDLVLLDLLMPEVDGFEVLRQMQADAKLQQIPVVVVTAVGDSERVAKCMQMGAIDQLNKPVDTILLSKRLDSILTRAS